MMHSFKMHRIFGNNLRLQPKSNLGVQNAPKVQRPHEFGWNRIDRNLVRAHPRQIPGSTKSQSPVDSPL